MKNSALQQTRAYVNDNKQFIEGNVSEHLLNNFWNNDNVFYEYLTDEEIENMNNDVELTKKLGEEVEKFINNNFDFDISEFEYQQG